MAEIVTTGTSGRSPIADTMRGMSLFNYLLLGSHIGAGAVALIMAPLAMATVKGLSAHRRWGRIYFWAMAWIFVSALLLLATYRFNLFLLPISVLSFYPAFTGYRCLYQKGGGSGNPRGQPADWAACAGVLLFGVGFAAWAVRGILGPPDGYLPGFHGLGLVFSALMISYGLRDVGRFRQPSDEPRWWLVYHFERMIGSYGTTLVAFAVNVIGRHLPPDLVWTAWIFPAFAVVPLISHFRSRYEPAHASA